MINKEDFLNTYKKIEKYEDTPHILPFWKNINKQVLSDFSPHPPDNYLLNKHLGQTMYSHNTDWAKIHLEYLLSKYSKEQVLNMVKENQIGGTVIINKEFEASCNSIHHQYHLDHFLSNCNAKNINMQNVDIVEWGGGYGRIPFGLERRTDIKWKRYTIIDTPVFCSLQNYYLTELGYKTNVVTETTPYSDDLNIINLIPVGLLDKVELTINCDIFLAMWSLSESSVVSVDYLNRNNFFNANKLFLGYHGYKDGDLPSGNILFELIKQYNNTTIEASFVSGHYYSVVNKDGNL